MMMKEMILITAILAALAFGAAEPATEPTERTVEVEMEPVSDSYNRPKSQPSAEEWEAQPVPGLDEMLCTMTENTADVVNFLASADVDGDGEEEEITFRSFYTDGDEAPPMSHIAVRKGTEVYQSYESGTALASPFHVYMYEDPDGEILLIWNIYALNSGENIVMAAKFSGDVLEYASLPWKSIDSCTDGVLSCGEETCAVDELVFQEGDHYSTKS